MKIKNIIKININNYFQKLFIKYSYHKKVIVINFHKISNKINDYNEIGTKIHVSSFKKTISFLNNNFQIITPDEFENHNYKFSKNEKIKILLTFDDGYKDNLDNALPILNQHNNKAIFFISPKYISSNKKIWDEALLDYLKSKLQINSNINFEKFKINKNNISKKIFSVINYLKFLNSEERDFILERNNFFKYDSLNSDICMSWNQVNELISYGMTIGSHGYSHTSLSNLEKEDLLNEIIKSKIAIEENTKTLCSFFSLPYGSKNDYNNYVIRNLISSNYKKCFLNHGLFNLSDKNNFCVNRISLTNDYKIILIKC